MGKDLKGKELGKGFNQRPDGRYEARADRIGDVALVDWMCGKQGERIPRKCGQVLRKL